MQIGWGMAGQSARKCLVPVYRLEGKPGAKYISALLIAKLEGHDVYRLYKHGHYYYLREHHILIALCFCDPVGSLILHESHQENYTDLSLELCDLSLECVFPFHFG